MGNLSIRPYRDEWALQLTDLFHRAVHAIPPSVYSRAEQEAWAPTPPDYAEWQQRLALLQLDVALLDGNIAGFVGLSGREHIEYLFTEPRWQGRGVASALYRCVQERAQAGGAEWLTVDASLVARPFFERRGFTVTRENQLQRNGVILHNVTMRKSLSECP